MSFERETFAGRLRSPVSWVIFLIAATIAAMFVLIGLRSWNQPFSGTLETDRLVFVPAADTELVPIISQEITVRFRGSVETPMQFSSRDEPMVIKIFHLENIRSKELPAQRDGVAALPTISPLRLAAGGRVSLEAQSGDDSAELRIAMPPQSIRLVAAAGAMISIESPICDFSDCPSGRELQSRQEIILRPRSGEELTISFDTLRAGQPLSELVSVSSFETWSLVQSGVGQVRTSGVTGGFVRFANTPDLTNTILPREIVDLAGRDITLRALRIEDKEFRFQMSGSLDHATTEVGREEVSMMPSWFEVLSNDARVRYALGVLTVLLGVGQLLGWKNEIPRVRQ